MAGAKARGIAAVEASEFQSIAGKGVFGVVEGRPVALGNEALLADQGIAPAALAERARALRGEGQTVVLIAIDGRLAGLLGVADPVRPDAAESLRALQREGLRVVMVTGDSSITARAVAGRLGLTDVQAGALPAEKAALVERLRKEGRVVAMAGDGINDAPALAAAHVGIAMGTGTDVAMQSAGVTLVHGDLQALLRARRLSRVTMRNIRQNLFFAFAYNALGVPIAAGALYPLLGVLLSPMIASAAMSFSSVSVIGNALRLRGVRLDGPGA
jgi:Cu+-exporting ATPase